MIARLIYLMAGVLCLLYSLDAKAQQRRQYRFELMLMPGLTLFDGDLGGRGPNHSSYLHGVKYSMGIGFRYIVSNKLAFRAEITQGAYNGTDEISSDKGRLNRNLSFRSNLTSVNVIAELSLVNWKQINPKRGAYKSASANGNLYVFIGFGGFVFNPKATYNGSEYALRPLGTEGQGLKIGTAFYAQYSWSIPFGVGYRHRFNRAQSLGIEIQFHKTGTDYMDDVSTFYYNNQAIRDAYGDVAAELADRRLTKQKGKETGKRGNSLENDFFLFPRITYNHKIGAGKRGSSYGGKGRKKRSKPYCPKF